MAWVDNIPRTDQTFGEATDDIRNNLALLKDSQVVDEGSTAEKRISR